LGLDVYGITIGIVGFLGDGRLIEKMCGKIVRKI
jgi:hypothetical protein